MYDGTKPQSFKHRFDDPEGIQSMNLWPIPQELLSQI